MSTFQNSLEYGTIVEGVALRPRSRMPRSWDLIYDPLCRVVKYYGEARNCAAELRAQVILVGRLLGEHL